MTYRWPLPAGEKISPFFYLYCSRVLKRLGALAPVEPITLSPEMLLQNLICCPNHTGMTLLSNGCKCESSNDKCDKIIKDERQRVSPNAATMLMSPGCNSFTLRFKWQLAPPTLSDCDRHLTHICREPFWEKTKLRLGLALGKIIAGFWSDRQKAIIERVPRMRDPASNVKSSWY